jgi:DNA-binding transcriptional MocR family regulator
VVGVPNQRGELSVDALEAACSAHDPRLLYLVPTFSNPTGRSLSVASRSAVLRLASARGLLVIEDDTYGFLGLDGPPPSPLKRDDADERVVYITSLAKTLAPALRLGAVIAPASLMPSLAAAKQSSDLVCSALLQRALADYLRSGRLAAHLDAVRPLYRERRDAMMSALERHLPQCGWARPEGGLSVWVDLPEGIVERDLTVDALRRGVGIAPGSAFFPRPRRCGSIRLSFGAHPPERIEQGVASLGRVLERHLPGSLEGMPLAGGAAGPLI